MALLKQAAATVVALQVVSVPAGIALHEHDDVDVQDAGHANCDTCHFQHLAGVEADGAPAPSAPDPVAAAVVSAFLDGDQAAELGGCPPRGPPA